MEHEVEWFVLARTSRRRRPNLAEDHGTKLHVARVVDAVDVSEGRGYEVATLLAESEVLNCGSPSSGPK